MFLFSSEVNIVERFLWPEVVVGLIRQEIQWVSWVVGLHPTVFPGPGPTNHLVTWAPQCCTHVHQCTHVQSSSDRWSPAPLISERDGPGPTTVSWCINCWHNEDKYLHSIIVQIAFIVTVFSNLPATLHRPDLHDVPPVYYKCMDDRDIILQQSWAGGGVCT